VSTRDNSTRIKSDDLKPDHKPRPGMNKNERAIYDRKRRQAASIAREHAPSPVTVRYVEPSPRDTSPRPALGFTTYPSLDLDPDKPRFLDPDKSRFLGFTWTSTDPRATAAEAQRKHINQD
jgi:hypothetical protein